MNSGNHVHRDRDLDDREEIAEFVERFYRDLSQDERFHPYFAGIDWHAHLQTLEDFWATTLLGSEDYDSDADHVIETHRPINAERPFDAALFDRWLELLHQTLEDGWSGPKATLAGRRGHGIAWAMANRLSNINIGTGR